MTHAVRVDGERNAREDFPQNRLMRQSLTVRVTESVKVKKKSQQTERKDTYSLLEGMNASERF